MAKLGNIPKPILIGIGVLVVIGGLVAIFMAAGSPSAQTSTVAATQTAFAPTEQAAVAAHATADGPHATAEVVVTAVHVTAVALGIETPSAPTESARELQSSQPTKAPHQSLQGSARIKPAGTPVPATFSPTLGTSCRGETPKYAPGFSRQDDPFCSPNCGWKWVKGGRPWCQTK